MFLLTLDIEFHPEKGREDTCFHGYAKAKENRPLCSHVETENQCCSMVISLAMILSLLIVEFLLEKE